MPEVALTLASTVRDLPQIERALLDMAGRQSAEHATLASTYYDTTAGRLRRDGLVLQVRKQNGLQTQMVIRADAREEPLSALHELADDERPDLYTLNGNAHLPEVLGDPELRARFTT